MIFLFYLHTRTYNISFRYRSVEIKKKGKFNKGLFKPKKVVL